jgi:hypothetical protein
MSSQTEQLQGVMTFFKLDNAGEQGVTQVRHKPGPGRVQAAPAAKAAKATAAPKAAGKPATGAPAEQDFERF